MRKQEHDNKWEMMEQGCKEIRYTMTKLQLQGGINTFAAVERRQ